MPQQRPQQLGLSAPRLFYCCSYLTLRERITLRETVFRRLVLRKRTGRE